MTKTKIVCTFEEVPMYQNFYIRRWNDGVDSDCVSLVKTPTGPESIEFGGVDLDQDQRCWYYEV